MIGQATALLAPFPRRWVLRAWGIPDIHTRQKWRIIWPELQRMPQTGLSLLDAGCANGRWALELAARRPGWRVVGVDRDRRRIAEAEVGRARLGLKNVEFVPADFVSFVPDNGFDLVLSVMSAHYLVAEGRGDELFGRFHDWLKPGGQLLLLGPRMSREVPFSSRLPHPAWHNVLSDVEICALCRESNFRVRELRGAIGMCGVLAKQLDWAVDRRMRPLKGLFYPVAFALNAMDGWVPHSARVRTLMWLLVAQAAFKRRNGNRLD